MKPTPDDTQPRRDGWFEHKGTWAEVTVGTVLASRARRTERWEVIAMAHGQQVEPIHTLWMRIREQTTGVEHSISPRCKTVPIIILTQSPADTEPLPPQPPEDSEAIMLLVRELGAEVMASRDEVTGEIVCPDYTYRSHIPGKWSEGVISRGLIEHMRFAHALSVDDDIHLYDSITLHGQAHNPRWPNIGKGGFPHRHVPEELDMF